MAATLPAMSAEKPYQAMRLLPDGTSWTANYFYSYGLLSYIYETGNADFVDGKMIFLQGCRFDLH